VTEISGVRRGSVEDATRYWWIFLVTGAAWLLFAIIVFRFDYTSVNSIAILFGIAMIGAALNEIGNAAGSHGGWRIAHALLSLAFVVIAIVSFIHPGNTFNALAAVMSFYFVIKGIFDVALAIFVRRELDLWWLRLLLGLAELAVGFWAAGNFGHRQILLIVFVGAVALTRGLTEILFAFGLRAAGHDLTARGP
jgi:uncharacterized membrane protein HdeD (DUF308 family)